ncbi:MAG: hypothetical protein ABIT20_22070 [Gemmatimonadaceae bacterium]
MGTTMTGCGPATRDLIARLMSPTRNRYYYGKLLDSYHLELEQDYGNNKRWMLNRLSLGAGVLCGLNVGANADGTRIRVSSGVGIDYFGREIIVPQTSQPFDPTQPTDDCGRPVGDPIRQGAVTLYLCYHECEAEPAPALVDECGDSACENGLVRERYRLRVAAGLPAPPGSISDAECDTISAQPAPGLTRRTVICRTLGGPCAAPDDSCIPIATFDVNGGVVGPIDTCTFRTTVYSNAVLLDLILCLAERVDGCCGPVVATMSIKVVDGDNQAAPAGQLLPDPLVARVSQGGAIVANEPVTFEVIAGGGRIGVTAGALGSAPISPTTNAAGDAEFRWELGPTAGSPQQVKASIANGAFVIFNAKAQQGAPVALPPVVLQIWPKNGAQLGANAPQPERTWFSDFQKIPRIQITFDRKMDVGQLKTPTPWLRVYGVTRPTNTSVSLPPQVTRLQIGYAGAIGAPALGSVGGVTEEYRVDVTPALRRSDTRFLVLIDASAGNIIEAGPPGLLLDAEFNGTKLTTKQIDKLWDVDTTPTATDNATFANIASDTQTLPQSGNGIPGGRFHSWFEVLP